MKEGKVRLILFKISGHNQPELSCVPSFHGTRRQMCPREGVSPGPQDRAAGVDVWVSRAEPAWAPGAVTAVGPRVLPGTQAHPQSIQGEEEGLREDQGSPGC